LGGNPLHHWVHQISRAFQAGDKHEKQGVEVDKADGNQEQVEDDVEDKPITGPTPQEKAFDLVDIRFFHCFSPSL